MARIGGYGVKNTTIYLNVYDLHDNNAILYPWGLGFYHSGVQIGDQEYTFAGGAGIFYHEAKGAPPPAVFRESIAMGTFKGTTRDLETIIQSLRPSFGPDDYNVITKNCNHFANEFMVRLIGQEIPAWVNRMANFGSVCACMLPDQQANNSPVNAPPDSSSGFYTRPGRLATHQSTPQTPSSSQASTGRRLGASSELPVISQSTATGGYHPVATTDSVHEDPQTRREKMRAAAARRLGPTESNPSPSGRI